jgi:probable F420-dependent oxidoreductase
LGLGTQVKAHIKRRFSMSWERPVARLREYLGALRAIWDSFQTGEPLSLEGEFYRHTLMTPFFNPGPIEYPEIPVYIAGVNTALARLAGELCDGFHVHPFHSTEYVRRIVKPAIAEGAK